jgi:hypothetical protein
MTYNGSWLSDCGLLWQPDPVAEVLGFGVKDGDYASLDIKEGDL